MTSCLILAAGEGSRLRPLTSGTPKGLVPLLGKPLMSYQFDVLEAAGITDIAIATGYRADKFSSYKYPTYHNELFNQTNMVESLFSARSFISKSKGDLLISYGDIVYESGNLQSVLNGGGDLSVMVDRGWLDLWSVRNEDPINDAETLKLNQLGRIIEIGKKPKSLDEIEGQYTGLIRVPEHKKEDLVAFYDSLVKTDTYDGRNFDQMYMTSFIQMLIDAKWDVLPAHVENGWLEVDTVADLELYEKLSLEGNLEKLWDQNG